MYCYYRIVDGHLSRFFAYSVYSKKYYGCAVYTAGKTPIVQYVLERVHSNNMKHSHAARLPGRYTYVIYLDTLMDILNAESVGRLSLERVTD